GGYTHGQTNRHHMHDATQCDDKWERTYGRHCMCSLPRCMQGFAVPLGATGRQTTGPACRHEACHPLPCCLCLPGVQPRESTRQTRCSLAEERWRTMPVLSHFERVDT